MRLTRRIVIQLVIFSLLAVVALGIMIFGYMRLPALLGVGQYRVTVELPEAGGLYPRGNVTYRGTEVGTVESVNLTDTGVEAVLSLKSGIKIPSDLEAEVHSQSAVGEQYVPLLPRSGEGPVLKDGDVIPQDRTRVPTDVNTVLDDRQPRPGGDPARQPQDGRRRGLYRGRRARPGAVPARRRRNRAGHRRPQESRPADHPDRPVEADPGLPDRHRGFDPGVGVEPGDGHRPAADPGRRGGRDPGEGARRGRRGAGPVRPAAAHPADRVGQPGQRRRGRRHLPAEPRAAAGAVAAGHRHHAGDRRGQAEHQTGLQGRLPDLQPEPQPAAAMHHRVPAGPAAAGRRASRTIRTGRPATCTAASRRTRRSTCAAPATCRASPCLANARRR